jgi:Domain of unknown function (DUF4124)
LNKVSWILCFSALMAAAAVAGGAPGNGRVLYKWIDSQGVTHYGDRVPPEYAGQEQHIINSQGVEVSHQDAQKSAEQLAADEKRRQDQEDRLNRDRNLLSAYASVGEIERIRDQRLTLVSDQIKVTTQFLENLNGRMKKMRVNAMHFKPYNADPKAPSMPDQVAEDLVRLSNDIHTQEQNLEQKRGEESTMKKQFENDIDRFKELKHIQ